jgi:phosphate transport system protein
MTKHYQRELEILQKKLLALGEIVENAVHMAIEAIQKKDAQLAEKVQLIDAEIDQKEIEVEEDCLKILALYQPVAIDLRVIVSVLKMNNDLERIGDQASKIAYKARDLAKETNIPVEINFEPLVQITTEMLRDSLKSLITLDTALARKVRATDDKADEMKRNVRKEVIAAAKKNPEKLESFILMLGVARSLERIADLTTNIAEDVIYMVEGEIVRHAHID